MKHIFIIAGEASGDLLGARLMHALKKKQGAQLVFSGVGGPLMEAEGLKSLFPMSDLSVMGLVEVLRHFFRIYKRYRQTVKTIRDMKPDVLITIDAPDFNFRVARKVKNGNFPIIHYVAPTVWAWRPGRAADCAQFLDHLLALFPFEPPYFAEHNLDCTFVGHPIVEPAATFADGAGFRRMINMDKEAPLLCLLPGSRQGEIKRHTAHFAATFKKLLGAMPGLLGVVPTFPHLLPVLEHEFKRVLGDDIDRITFVDDTDLKYGAMAASDIALAASGTVTLELALLGVPTIVAYRVNPLTAYVGKKLIRVKHVSLVNILLNREIIPEFLQENCTVEKLTASVDHLFRNPEQRRIQRHYFKQAMDMLRVTGQTPSQKAAEVVLRSIGIQ